jgi:hypothetical protein
LRIRIIGIGAAAVAVGLAGCGSGGGTGPTPAAGKAAVAGIKPGEETSLMPMTEGSQWVYDAEQAVAVKGAEQVSQMQFTLRVTKSAKTAQGVVATLVTLVQGKPAGEQRIVMRPDGMFQLNADDATTLPDPQPAIVFPPDTDKTFKWVGPMTIGKGKTIPVSMTGKIMGIQEVDTDNGSFSALAVTQAFSSKDPKLFYKQELTSWYAPNVGLVRLWKLEQAKDGSSRRTTLKLKTYSLKK